MQKFTMEDGATENGNLPVERITEAPPFTYCGVDMFGSFFKREKPSDLKRYGAMFTCFVSRAVHIEVTNQNDIDSFV